VTATGEQRTRSTLSAGVSEATRMRREYEIDRFCTTSHPS
jgi:hypothetical protein